MNIAHVLRLFTGLAGDMGDVNPDDLCGVQQPVRHGCAGFHETGRELLRDGQQCAQLFFIADK